MPSMNGILAATALAAVQPGVLDERRHLTGHGVNPRFLSAVMKKEKYTDFCVIRPQKWAIPQINAALEAAFDAAQETIEYDYKLMFQIAIKRLTNRNIRMDSQRKDICSEFARRYARALLPHPRADNFEIPRMPNEFITPWDFVLYANPNFEVFFDDYKTEDLTNMGNLRTRGMKPA